MDIHFTISSFPVSYLPVSEGGFAHSKDIQIAYTAIDKIDTTIESEYLKEQGLVTLVEPLRFSWCIPIRTVVDQYVYMFSKKE